jgi:biotin carboxyl carrier protein
MIVAVYTHYFAFLVLLAHYVSFALHARHLRRLFLRWIACAAAVALAFSPWAISILLSGGYGDAVPPWITSVGWLDPLYTLLSFSAGHTIDPGSALPYLVLAVYLSGLVVAIRKIPPASQSDPGHWLPRRQLLLWFAVPLGLVFLLSLDWPGLPEAPFSLYVDRYLIVSLPAFVLLVAWGIDDVARRRSTLPVRSLAIGLVVLGTLPALINLYFNPLYWRADWRGLVDTLQAEVQTTDALLLADGQFLPLAHYGQSAPSSSKLPPPPPESAPAALLQAFEAEMASRVAEATVGEWQKKKGDRVERDENLVDLETDKVMLEGPARDAGVLKKIKAEKMVDGG